MTSLSTSSVINRNQSIKALTAHEKSNNSREVLESKYNIILQKTSQCQPLAFILGIVITKQLLINIITVDNTANQN